jgi:hypothetical protein
MNSEFEELFYDWNKQVSILVVLSASFGRMENFRDIFLKKKFPRKFSNGRRSTRGDSISTVKYKTLSLLSGKYAIHCLIRRVSIETNLKQTKSPQCVFCTNVRLTFVQQTHSVQGYTKIPFATASRCFVCPWNDSHFEITW